MIPDFHKEICNDCKRKITDSETWGSAAEGLENPEAYAKKILSMLCPSCRKNIIAIAKREQR